MSKHYLEIVMPPDGTPGTAFHETDFAGQIPPTEVHYCDCAGAGRKSHNPQTTSDPIDVWKTKHAGPYCSPRRQIFVDISDLNLDWRPNGLHAAAFSNGNLLYDESTKTFSVGK